ncbi:MAG: DNA gyrase subunit A [Clostridia bacterium]|nr:DNA gyrase subunit A [Clostridia bacterium]
MKNNNEIQHDENFVENLEYQTIIDVDIEKRMKEAFIDYSMSVIISRALPDVRDGLKPVHRRILYAMFEEHLTADKPFFKSATTVGNVIGRYHPHGDASAYDALVRMAQDFSLRYPLVDGHGNFGSIDGDPPAAYRYTEARMSKISNELMADIDKNTVDFVPNFDEKRKEPVVLPTRIPTLLVNGCSGIAVGMATNIPSHNLKEVISAAVAQIDNPDITVDELMEYVKGPDFPTSGTIMGKSGIRSAYETGRGRVVVRAKAEIIEAKNDRFSIVITEIPYQVNKTVLVKSIADLANEKKIEGISGIRDLSSKRDGIKILIDLKRDANPQVVLNHLYKFTRLQDSFSINMLAIEDGRPKVLTLKEILRNYIAFQQEIVTRRTKFDLDKALARMHILEGLRIALANIDEVIHVIRNSYDDAKERLMEKFGFSDIQAQSVLDMRLVQLQRLNGEKIDEEFHELELKVEEFRAILSDEGKLNEIIKEEISAIADKYGDERRTNIEAAIDDVDYEDLIAQEQVVITLTHFGYVKRLTTDTYKSQRRGGKGISALSTREEDFVKNIFTCSTHDYLLFFTTLGRMYKVKAYRIPEASRQAKGTAIQNILPLMKDEKVTTIIPLKEFIDGKYLTMVTKKGLVKKTDLMEYDTARKGGLYAISINEDDELMNVALTDGSQQVFIATKNGKSIRFNETDVRAMGRTAHGVRGIDLAEDDFVIGCEVVSSDSDMLIVTEKGYGKITDISEYKVQSRAGKGVKTYKITEKTGPLAGFTAIGENEDIMMITSSGTIIRTAISGINKMGRATQGVILMRLDEDEKIVSISKTEHEEPEEEIENTEGAENTTVEVTEEASNGNE